MPDGEAARDTGTCRSLGRAERSWTADCCGRWVQGFVPEAQTGQGGQRSQLYLPGTRTAKPKDGHTGEDPDIRGVLEAQGTSSNLGPAHFLALVMVPGA